MFLDDPILFQYFYLILHVVNFILKINWQIIDFICFVLQILILKLLVDSLFK